MEVVSLFSISGIVIPLLRSLAGAGGSQIGCRAMSKILGNTSQSDFIEMCDRIEDIVEQKLDGHTIEQTNAIIEGLAAWIERTYLPLKDEPTTSKKDLHDNLQVYVNKLGIELVPLLQVKKYAQAALGGFIIGASLHLSLLQELAQVDPNKAAENSTYVDTLKKYAIKYTKHARTTFEALRSARIKHVKSIKATTIRLNLGYVAVFEWEDKFTMEKWMFRQDSNSDNFKDETFDSDLVTRDRRTYIEMLEHELNGACNYPREAIIVWESLLEDPLSQTDRLSAYPNPETLFQPPSFHNNYWTRAFKKKTSRTKRLMEVKSAFKRWLFRAAVRIHSAFISNTKYLE